MSDHPLTTEIDPSITTPVVSRLFTCCPAGPSKAARPSTVGHSLDPVDETPRPEAEPKEVDARPSSNRAPWLQHQTGQPPFAWRPECSRRKRWQQVAVQCAACSLACLLVYTAICLTPWSVRRLRSGAEAQTGGSAQDEDRRVAMPALPAPSVGMADCPTLATPAETRGVEIMARLEGRIEPYTRQ